MGCHRRRGYQGWDLGIINLSVCDNSILIRLFIICVTRKPYPTTH